MSKSKLLAEAQRWLKTSKMDFRAAKILLREGEYALSCFHSHQAAEKALKAIWYALDSDPWGHSLQKLIRELSFVDEKVYKALSPLLKEAAYLDKLYIPTRYPNGLPDLTPDESYTEEEACEALKRAEKFLQKIEELLQSLF
jgi:HEPN domain-containing protein